MEMNFHPASRGAAATGIALGASALGLPLVGGAIKGAISGLTGGGGHCDTSAALAAAMIANSSAPRYTCEGVPATRYDLEQQKAIIDRDAEIAYLKGRDAAKSDSLEMYKYVDGRLRGIEAQIAQQAVYNATNTATLNCLNGQVAQLMALTKTVIPITNVCPEPMARYNSWTAPAAPATAG